MFKTKHVSSNATTSLKLFKMDNVPINVIVVVTTRSQQSKQRVFKEKELAKTKGVEQWQQEERLHGFFI
jgi:outer membrane cobalamin receptor